MKSLSQDGKSLLSVPLLRTLDQPSPHLNEPDKMGHTKTCADCRADQNESGGSAGIFQDEKSCESPKQVNERYSA